jgi:essential nuclear protein 1
MQCSGSTVHPTMFYQALLLKDPWRSLLQVIDSLVRHFMRCHDDERQMPVVWHQTLLCFVQRYKDDIRQEDRELLRKLCQVGGC